MVSHRRSQGPTTQATLAGEAGAGEEEELEEVEVGEEEEVVVDEVDGTDEEEERWVDEHPFG